MSKHYLLLIISVFILSLFGSINPAFAATSISASPSLQVSPGIIERIINPGASTSFTVTVTNKSSTALPIYISIDPYSNDYANTQATNWISLPSEYFILNPNVPQTVTINVKAPKKASPGGHYLVINFIPLTPSTSLRSYYTPVVERLGVLTFLIINGPTSEKAQFTNLTVENGGRSKPTKITLGIKNTGNIGLLVHGVVHIYKGRKVLASLPFGSSAVLPDINRQYNLSWQDHNGYGSYYAQATVIYGEHNVQLTSKKVNFSISPVPVIITILLPLILLTLFYWRTHKRWRKALIVLIKGNK